MNDPPPPAAPPDHKEGGDRSAMIPQEMAIQLLQSKDARIAAAAARVFSPSRHGSPILAAAMAAVASQPSPPTVELPPAASESMGGESIQSIPSAERNASVSSSPTLVGAKDTADTNDDSAASALQAMASAKTSADHAKRSASTGPTASAVALTVPRMPGKKFSSTERLQRR